jgi:hypothetical protein
MKQLFLFLIIVIVGTSCLKESIADAMLHSQSSGTDVASLSFEVNGKLIQQSVYTVHQSDQNYQLACFRTAYTGGINYDFDFLTPLGEFTNAINTDSLKPGQYINQGFAGGLFVFDDQNRNYFLTFSTDTVSFTITSNKNGFISGNFNARLTELVSQSGNTNSYGTPGSCVITKGTFSNIPVY